MSRFNYKLVTGDVELREALEVRRQVFVRGQGISEDLVFDAHNREALHVVAKDGERVIGSARVQFLANNQAKLERMAILKRYRRKGIGRQILLFLDAVLKCKQVQQVIIHAQLEVIPFYKSCGFDQVGLPFQEAGIKHIEMRRQL
ncbi:MAG: GNAT family N-acetyltransferase [Dehalococcoidia bacterium]|nr:GNAT family N-acetyltransferase [Dehalococcoidia bacterium]MDH4291207.1 GNAT family N-acetyltransferase [Dehalococcoidia bacterium]